MLARAALLGLLFILLSLVFIGRLAQLQLVQGAEYADAAMDARLLAEVLPARRGKILDRHGKVIADNRAVYQVAVILDQLELPRRERARTIFYRFDRERFDLLLADLSNRLRRNIDDIRRVVSEELLLNPGVAIRYGPKVEDLHLGLLAIPKEVLVAAEADGSAGDDPAWRSLAESGLLLQDPREAIAEEFFRRRGQGVDLINQNEWDAFLGLLAQSFETPSEHLVQVLTSFTPIMELPHSTDEDAIVLQWRALAEDRLLQAEDTLARFLGQPTRVVRDHLRRHLDAIRSPTPTTEWLYVPSARIHELASRLPAEAPVRELPVNGALPQRERIFLIQGNHPGNTSENRGMFDLIVARLVAALEVPGSQSHDWLGALIETHGDPIGPRTAERDHRIHQLAFNAQALERCSRELSKLLSSVDASWTSIGVEQSITMARRQADREWRGFTRHDPLVLAEDIPHRLAISIAGAGGDVPRTYARNFEESTAPIPGLRIVTGVGREYPHPGVAPHVIGFLGRLNAVYDHQTALAMGLDPEGWLGRSGLESEYDELLQGVNGRRLRLRTPAGYKLLEETPPVPGVDLNLTLDLALQKVSEQALGNWHALATELNLNNEKMDKAHAIANHGRAGMVLVDVRDGAILSLASHPTFNLSEVRRRYSELQDPSLHPGRPLYDHASDGSQPPGSTVKPLVAMLALDAGVVQPHEEIFSKGYMARTAGGLPILREHGRYFQPRNFNVSNSITKSSNVFYATLGERLGKQRLSMGLRRFGLGQRHAIDVGWQRPGLLPTPENLPRIRPQEPVWYPSDSWRMAIGQFASSSPLQVVTIPAAIANGGRIVRPYLWQGAAPAEDLPQLKISAAGMRVVREGMENVTETGGTASKLQLTNGMKVAAKTGTSEWGSRISRKLENYESGRAKTWTPDHAWLIGYAPAHKPEVAFCIYVYAGTSGGRACTGIAKKVLEAYFAGTGR